MLFFHVKQVNTDLCFGAPTKVFFVSASIQVTTQTGGM